jgi:hypothetical protein
MGVRGGVKAVKPEEKAHRWDHALSRGYLTPRQIAECIEFANAAMRRVK